MSSHPAVSNCRFTHSLNDTRDDQGEIVIVTTKQYLAVADDFLHKLFPELTPGRPPYPGPFTVFITDDVIH
ncbi:MAG: hypothetical protein ACRD2L_14290 [Terriglobia bacterium]